MQQTMEQKRAAHAWSKAKEGVSKHAKDYVNDAKGLPALIMNSGLMQVLAFLHGKKERQQLLCSHMLDWLHQTHGTPKAFEPFMEDLAHTNPERFRAITSEAFAWLRWLRQVAPAVYKGD